MVDHPTPTEGAASPQRRDRTHYLYLAVVLAVLAGIAVGFASPELAKSFKPLGTAFVNLIKMMISPIIFCTIVLGIGSVRRAAKIGKVGGLALGYFLGMSTLALAIGLLVGNLIKPGAGLHLTPQLAGAGAAAAAGEHTTTTEFLLGIVPNSLFSSLTSGQVLQTLLVALLVGFAIQALGAKGEPIVRAVSHLQRLVFRILAMIMWVAPIGAFGAMAALIGATGVGALANLGKIMLGFYITCGVFIFLILGGVYRLVTGLSLFKLLRYLAREFLLILSTSSSETALPRLIAKMEHLGVSRPVVGVTVSSFQLDLSRSGLVRRRP